MGLQDDNDFATLLSRVEISEPRLDVCPNCGMRFSGTESLREMEKHRKGTCISLSQRISKQQYRKRQKLLPFSD